MKEFWLYSTSYSVNIYIVGHFDNRVKNPIFSHFYVPMCFFPRLTITFKPNSPICCISCSIVLNSDCFDGDRLGLTVLLEDSCIFLKSSVMPLSDLTTNWCVKVSSRTLTCWSRLLFLRSFHDTTLSWEHVSPLSTSAGVMSYLCAAPWVSYLQTLEFSALISFYLFKTELYFR